MRDDEKLTLHVVEQHPLAVDCLRSILTAFAETCFHPSIPQSIPSEAPLLFLVDIGTLAEPLGDLLRSVRLTYPNARVVALDSQFSDDHVTELLFLGVVGFVSYKDAPKDLPVAIRSVAEGTAWVDAHTLEKFGRRKFLYARDGHKGELTRREIAVLNLLRKGFCNEEIGSSLGISVSTVKFHLENIFAKIGIHDRLRAAEWLGQTSILETTSGPDLAFPSESQPVTTCSVEKNKCRSTNKEHVEIIPGLV